MQLSVTLGFLSKSYMKLVFLMVGILLTAQCQEPSHPKALIKHTQTVNEGLEELIQEKITRLNLAAMETSKLDDQKKDARFYYKNTYQLIEPQIKESDSLVFWRLTKSMQANKYGFKSSLDSSIVFGQDSLMQKSALLFNLHEYITHIYHTYSYCGIIFGSIPVRDTIDPNTIYLHGTPHEYSELNILSKRADEFTSTAIDTIPVWGKLILSH